MSVHQKETFHVGYAKPLPKACTQTNKPKQTKWNYSAVSHKHSIISIETHTAANCREKTTFGHDTRGKKTCCFLGLYNSSYPEFTVLCSSIETPDWSVVCTVEVSPFYSNLILYTLGWNSPHIHSFQTSESGQKRCPEQLRFRKRAEYQKGHIWECLISMLILQKNPKIWSLHFLCGTFFLQSLHDEIKICGTLKPNTETTRSEEYTNVHPSYN